MNAATQGTGVVPSNNAFNQQKQQQEFLIMNNNSNNNNNNNPLTSTEEVLAPYACRNCKLSHKKCDRKLPACSQCSIRPRKGPLTCVYEPKKKRRSKAGANNVTCDSDSGNNSVISSTTTATTTNEQQPILLLLQHQHQQQQQTQTQLQQQQQQQQQQPHMIPPFMYEEEEVEEDNDTDFSSMLLGNQPLLYPRNKQPRLNSQAPLLMEQLASGTTVSSFNELNADPLHGALQLLSTSQIIEACFKLYIPDCSNGPISQDEFKQRVTSQFLWKKCVDLPIESLQDIQTKLQTKADEAFWFAFQSIALANLPVVSRGNEQLLGMENCLFQEFVAYIDLEYTGTIERVNVMVNLVKSSPRPHILHASKHMFNLARAIILDPEVFSYITSNRKLVQTCACLSMYLLAVGERLDEVDIFLRPLKMFADREACEIKKQLATVSGSGGRDQLIRDLHQAQGFSMLYVYGKSELWFISIMKNKNVETKKSLQKYVKLRLDSVMQFAYDIPSLVWTRDVTIKEQELLKILKSIVDRIPQFNDVTDWIFQLEQFLNGCKIVIEKCLEFSDARITAVWKVCNMFMLQVFACELGAAQFEGMITGHIFDRFTKLQLDLATEITVEGIANLPMAASAGAFMTVIMNFVTKVHVEWATRLCSSPHSSSEELIECCSILAKDGIILDATFQKYGTLESYELKEKVQQQQRLVAHHISENYVPATLGALDYIEMMDTSRLNHSVSMTSSNHVAPTSQHSQISGTPDPEVLTDEFSSFLADAFWDQLL